MYKRQRLEGHWASTRAAALAERLLSRAGLDLRKGTDDIRAARPENPAPQAPDADDLRAVAAGAPDLLPLAVLLAAVAVRNGQPAVLPALPGAEAEVCEAFLARLGLRPDEGGELKPAQEANGAETAPLPAWLAPSAPWAVALALGAFLKPHLHLGNPGVLTDLFPAFWALYNTLPTPELGRKKPEPVDVKPARRRIIAQGVYGELPPDPPAGDDD